MPAGASLTLDYSSSTLKRNLGNMETKLGAAILMYASTKAIEYESYMKMNRPWTDRTNQAKATLNAKVSQPDINTVRITLAHGVDYGIWLELAHGRNWAIVAPTINEKGPDYISGFRDIMSKIKV